MIWLNIFQQMDIIPNFKTDDFVLYNGDNLDVMISFPDNYVDMIFADPPYNLSNEGLLVMQEKW